VNLVVVIGVVDVEWWRRARVAEEAEELYLEGNGAWRGV